MLSPETNRLIVNQQELINIIALTKLKSLNLTDLKLLFESAGSATAVLEHSKNIRQLLPTASDRLVRALAYTGDALRVAEKEMVFIENKHIRTLTISDNDYPQRLKECADAPLVLYACGDTDFNRKHVICMVGTRKCTEYGREICNAFVSQLKELVPDTLIVSGLAYGIDICSHRAALANEMDTVGVVAHGLDNVYPSAHRQTAVEMVRSGGGMLTEYTTNTRPEKMNFVRRNRIVAGMSDACIVVESAAKGGSLITAHMAMDYNREVFAFPGRTFDEQSAGCNHLIMNHEAMLITSASEFVAAMGWESAQATSKHEAIQQELFLELNKDELAVVNMLKNTEDEHINAISAATGINFSSASAILFELEMKGVVKSLGGARYRLIRTGL